MPCRLSSTVHSCSPSCCFTGFPLGGFHVKRSYCVENCDARRWRACGVSTVLPATPFPVYQWQLYSLGCRVSRETSADDRRVRRGNGIRPFGSLRSLDDREGAWMPETKGRFDSLRSLNDRGAGRRVRRGRGHGRREWVRPVRPPPAPRPRRASPCASSGPSAPTRSPPAHCDP